MTRIIDFTLDSNFYKKWVRFYFFFYYPLSIMIIALMYKGLYDDVLPNIQLLSIFIQLLLVCLHLITLKLTIENILIGSKAVQFTGNIKTLFSIFLKNLLLSIITLGIYLPWFYKNIVKYFYSHIEINNKSFEFTETGKSLFLFLFVSIIIFVVIFVVILVAFILCLSDSLDIFFLPTLSMLASMIFLVPLFWSKFIRWSLSVKYDEFSVSLNLKMFKLAWFLFGQYFLTLITFHLYMPKMMMNMHEKILNNLLIVNENNDTKKQKFIVSFMPGDYFFLLSNLFVSIITLGIYTPKTSFRVMKCFCERTSLILVDSEEELKALDF